MLITLFSIRKQVKTPEQLQQMKEENLGKSDEASMEQKKVEKKEERSEILQHCATF